MSIGCWKDWAVADLRLGAKTSFIAIENIVLFQEVLKQIWIGINEKPETKLETKVKQKEKQEFKIDC